MRAHRHPDAVVEAGCTHDYRGLSSALCRPEEYGPSGGKTAVDDARPVVERSDLDRRPTGMRLCWTILILVLTLSACTGSDSADPESAPTSQDTVTSTPATINSPPTDVGLSDVRGQAIMVLGCLEGPGIVCRRLEVSAHIEVRAAGGSRVVAQTVTDRDGNFKLELPAGRYTVTATVTSEIKAKPVRTSLKVQPGAEAGLVIRFRIGAGRPFLVEQPSPR